jgi:hypothetical protein
MKKVSALLLPFSAILIFFASSNLDEDSSVTNSKTQSVKVLELYKKNTELIV